ncbi:ISKra4 family transposase [Geitlerinema sp. P-1104]|uniref:ISKra4 family transposase n=1 Tax=Geitlerinema sp. P-1104 TaxID=2546230 RepID=UPI00147722D1|nr:ISKra4 family transposase [Geitlerinema sp. P-1104]NMG58244.1 ISKra4 family transposase [Geitlerinema sp. P-1104]
MNPQKQAELQQHLDAIAKILYQEADPAELTTLEGIEKNVRAQAQKHVLPQLGGFFINAATDRHSGKQRTLTSILGKLTLTTAQAQQLQVKPRTRWSPYFSKCCALVSANASYQRAEEDLAMLTGVSISHSTLQRLVQREDWCEVDITEPIEELSLDGGMIRLRTEEGQPGQWREYKALNVHEHGGVAFFKDNPGLISWANDQTLAEEFTSLGDGHDGVWNIFDGIGTPEQRIEVLDWYHLIENAHKVPGTAAELSQIRALLWRGKTRQVIRYLRQERCRGSSGFINYLKHHSKRIIDYQAWQEAGHSIGSVRVESLVKQIGLRVKLPGAQWRGENVPKVLKHRCAYLNGDLVA